MKIKAKSLKGKSFLKTLLTKVRKFLTILFALGVDKHLDYDQDAINPEEHKNEKKKDG